MGKVYQEIRLHDLSPSESQNMVESLLKAKDIPPELRMFIRTRVEGNPFYLEEAINALIESETLVREGGSWKLTKDLSEANIPSTIQGIISARIDRLEKETKKVFQEASVIGRIFLYEILKRISELREHVERSIISLERLDLIRVRSLQPNIEYLFKHALTQEAVYNGILKKERHNIHERIGLVMEDLFAERLPEFYETLAFHFKQGYSTLKAIDYLIKAGHEKPWQDMPWMKPTSVTKTHSKLLKGKQIERRRKQPFLWISSSNGPSFYTAAVISWSWWIC